MLNRNAFTEAGDYEIDLSAESMGASHWTISLPDENEEPLGAYVVEIDFGEEIELLVLHGDPAPRPPRC